VNGGGNDGSLQKVGLVRGPDASVPKMFTVYLGSNVNPWNWHNGAIPASELGNISRITVAVTTEARSPSKDGTYARSTLTTDINSIRNVPTAGMTVYNVSGFVFKDVNKNGTRDVGEPGVANAILRLGTVSVVSSSSTGSYTVDRTSGHLRPDPGSASGLRAFGPNTLSVDSGRDAWQRHLQLRRHGADRRLAGRHLLCLQQLEQHFRRG
jgi:hypothetical protein